MSISTQHFFFPSDALHHQYAWTAPAAPNRLPLAPLSLGLVVHVHPHTVREVGENIGGPPRDRADQGPAWPRGPGRKDPALPQPCDISCFSALSPNSFRVPFFSRFHRWLFFFAFSLVGMGKCSLHFRNVQSLNLCGTSHAKIPPDHCKDLCLMAMALLTLRPRLWGKEGICCSGGASAVG